MRKKLLPLVLGLCVILSLFCGCTAATALEAGGYDTDGVIAFSGSTVDISGTGVTIDSDGDVRISVGGVYMITGTASPARVVVEAAETEDVTLILSGANLTYELDETIYIKSAGSATLIIADGTENTIVSGVAPDPTDEEDEDASAATEEEEEDASGAAIRAKCPLTITGSGRLTVYGYINNGIAANGDLVIESGDITVTAVNDAIKSKADLTINGGVFDLTADMDGVQADGALTVTDGTFSIYTGAGSEGAEVKVSDSAMMGDMGGFGDMGGSSREMGGSSGEASQEASGEAWDAEAEEFSATTDGESAAGASSAEFQAGGQMSGWSASGEMSGASGEMGGSSGEMGGGPGGMGGFGGDMNWDADDTDSGSHKGLKGVGSVTITGGTFLLDTEDDAIHSDGDVTITGGEFTILSGDDGIHGDTSLTISGGTVDIQTSYEGLEAQSILISGGYISIVASDDGMNANGGTMFGFGGASGASGETSSDSSDSPVLRITGGVVYVDAGGDGLDSNGDIYIEGGTVYVSGPSSNWDSAIDYGDGNYEFVITGGTLLAAGYSGMAEAPDSTEDSQPSIYYAADVYAEDGALMTLTDADGNVLAEYSFVHGYNCVVISTPDLTIGETYTLSIGGVETVIELTSAVYSNRSMGGMGDMGGDMGGGPGGGGR